MKINFKQPILDIDDKPIKEGLWMTLDKCVLNVLDWQLKGDETIPGERKGKMGFIALQIRYAMKGDGVVDLESEEISLIKSRIGLAAPNLVIFRCNLLLEGKDQIPEEFKPKNEKPNEDLAT